MAHSVKPFKPRWLLAQDFILEVGGRVSGLGLFMDDTVWLVMPEGAPEPTKQQPVKVRDIALLLACAGSESAKKFVISVKPPGGKTLEVTMQAIENEAPVHNVIINLGAMPIQAFGKCKVTAECEAIGLKSTYQFEIKRRNVPLAEPSEEARTLSVGKNKPLTERPRRR